MSNETVIWQRASEIFARLSDLPVTEAMEQLREQQNLTEEVRDAVLVLINSAEHASRFFEDKILKAIPSQFQNVMKPGDKLDEYELLEQLGHGGMSQVFKAKRLKGTPQKLVAIKVFAPRSNQQELLSHFINEQQILSKFSHANIVDMLHGGKTDDNIAYLVMELVENALPIDKFCNQHNLSDREKVSYILQCVDALSYSHSNLIIHRDLKPDNILINQDKQLKIVDFGIAKLINNEISRDQTTIMALTPGFAAPEQINSQAITIKTDVFSLAVVALSVLANTSPLPKDRLLKSCADDQLYLDKLIKNAGIDKDLKNILRKASQVEADLRYANMHLFAQDLKNWLNNKPVSATSPSIFYKLSKFAQRRKALFVSLTGLIATIIISFILLLWQNNKIRIEAEKAKQVKEFMLDTFKNTDPDINKGQKVSANDLLLAAAEKIENNQQMNPEIRTELIESIGIAFGKLGLYNDSIRYLNQSLQLNPHQETTLSYLAENYFNAKKYDELEKHLKEIPWDKLKSDEDKFRALQIKARYEARNIRFEEAFQTIEELQNLNLNDLKHQIEIQRLLAEVHFYQSPTDKSVEIIEDVLKNPNLEKNQSIVFELRAELAEYLIQIGEHDKALQELKSLVNDQSALLGPNHPALLESLRVLSATLKDMSQFDEAQKVSERAYQISSNHFGENSIQTGYVLNNLAVIAHQRGDTQKAEELLKKAVDIFDKELPAEYADALELKSNYAATLYSNKKYEDALKIIEQIYQVQKDKLGKNHNQTLYTRKLWAETLGKLGDEQQAIEIIDQTKALAIENLGIDNPMTQQIIYSQGIIYQTYNRFGKAEEFYQQIMSTETDPPSPLIRKTARRLAITQAELGKIESAMSNFEKTIELSDKALGKSHPISLDSMFYFIEFLIHTNQFNLAKQKLDDFKSRINDDDSLRQEQWRIFSNQLSDK